MEMLEGFVPWPAEFAERYRREGYWRGISLGDLLAEWADVHSDRTAVVSGDVRWSYRELDRQASRLAAGFRANGVGAGDAVVVQLLNSASTVAVLFGLFRLGARPVVALPAHRWNEIGYFCSFTEAVAYVMPVADGSFSYRELGDRVLAECSDVRTVFVDGAGGTEFGPGYVSLDELGDDSVAAPVGGEDFPAVDPGDVAIFLLSGGTTGVPKLVPRTHDDWVCSGRLMADATPYDPTTVTMIGLPVLHNWTLTHGMLATFHAGGKVVLAPSLDPSVAFDLIAAEGVTDVGLVPGIAMLWVEEAGWTDVDLSTLRRVAIGGTKLPDEIARTVEPALGCRLQQMFGMAEGLVGFVRDDDDDDVRLISQGRPIAAADELRVVDEADRAVPAGRVGELLARGPYTIRGYFRSAEHNARAFTPDGFYRTGDLVRLLPTGHVVFSGRVKDQINRGGEKVAAEEVENLVLEHPAVRDALVVGIPDAMLGERVCACVIPAGEGLSLADLRAHLAERGVAAYKHPDRLELVTAFPTTALGKVSKKLMVERLTAGFDS